jgi:hypothetical protein
LSKLSINLDSTSCLLKRPQPIELKNYTYTYNLSDVQSNATELIFYTLMAKNKVLIPYCRSGNRNSMCFQKLQWRVMHQVWKLIISLLKVEKLMEPWR